jgi:hypothetical protein
MADQTNCSAICRRLLSHKLLQMANEELPANADNLEAEMSGESTSLFGLPVTLP